jgi:hypothetical protein
MNGIQSTIKQKPTQVPPGAGFCKKLIIPWPQKALSFLKKS